VVETFDALVSERGDTGKIWASLLKDTLKRRRPDFSETYYGFRTFGNLLEDAQTRGLFEFGRDEKSGTYVYRSAQAIEALGAAAETEQLQAAPAFAAADAGDQLAVESQGEQPSEQPAAAPGREPRRRGGRGRKGREQAPEQAVPETAAAREDAAMASWPAPTPDLAEAPDSDLIPQDLQPEAPAAAAEPVDAAAEQPAAPVKERRRAPRKTATRKPRADTAAGADSAATPAVDTVSDLALAALAPVDFDTGSDAVTDADPSDPAPADGEDAQESAEAKAARKKSARPAHKAPSRKPAARARRPAKPKTDEGA